jgi:hypothetical protein
MGSRLLGVAVVKRGTTDLVGETRRMRARLDTTRALDRGWVKAVIALLDAGAASATAFLPDDLEDWERALLFAVAAIVAYAFSYFVVWTGSWIMAPRRQFEDATKDIKELRHKLNPPFKIEFENPRTEFDQGNQHIIRVNIVNRGPKGLFGAYLADTDGYRNYQGRHRIAWSNETKESITLYPSIPQPITVGFLQHKVVKGEYVYWVIPTGPPFPEYHMHGRIGLTGGQPDIRLTVEVINEQTGQSELCRLRVGHHINGEPYADQEAINS